MAATTADPKPTTPPAEPVRRGTPWQDPAKAAPPRGPRFAEGVAW